MLLLADLSLKSKILLGLLLIAGLSITAAIFSFWNLSHIEKEVNQINMHDIPLLKVLGQLESHQYFLDHEINDALQTKRSQLENFHLQLMESKIGSLQRVFSEGDRRRSEASIEISKLVDSFHSYVNSIASVFSNGVSPRDKEMFSENRIEFINQIKKMIRDVEKRIHDTSLSVQEQISRSVSIIAAILALFSLFAAGLVYWIDKVLRPLQELKERVKEISNRGLQDVDVEILQKIAKRQDEIGLFSHEFSRMASSLLSRNWELEKKGLDLRRAHREMATQNESLKKTRIKLMHHEKLSLIGKLSAQMAHEIRNPLNALMLHLETIEFDINKSEGALSDSISSMKREIFRLSEVTESYLGLAKSPQLRFSEENLNQIIHELKEFYNPYFRENTINFSINLSKVPDFQMDKKYITLVLGNLLKNSIEAFSENVDEKQKAIEINTKYNVESNTVELLYKDNGPGINNEHTESIFSPFFTTKGSGTGLGLSHSKQIIDAHGGEISFYSKIGLGTTFYINFPLSKEISNV